jgi:hypothetical protein
MSQVKRLATALAVATALGLLVTASALAATEAYFKVEKGGVTTTLASGETRTQTISLPAEGRMYIPALKLTIACTNATGSAVIYNNYVGGVRKEGRLKSTSISFTGCSVVGQSGCYINGAISGAGKITTNTLAARLGYQPASTENVEADLYPEVAEKTFATVAITECASEGSYPIKGQLVAGIGPSNELMTAPIEGVITTSALVQQFKTIEFPVAKETLTGQELKFGTKEAAIEGAIELVLPGGEKVGYYTS